MYINSKEFKKALKKIGIVAGESVIFSVTLRKDKEGKNYGTVSSANQVAQAVATVMVEADITENERIIFGSEFITVIQTISQCGEVIELCKKENGTVEVSCNTTSIVMETKKDGGYITNLSPNKEEVVAYKLEADAFCFAVHTGGYTATTDGDSEKLKDAVSIEFSKDVVQVLSIAGSGTIAAKSKCNVMETKNEKEISFIASGTMLTRISRLLEKEVIELYLFEKKQLLIRDGNDFYTLIPKAGSFPAMNKFFECDKIKAINIICSVNELKIGLDIVLVNQKNPKIEVEVEGEGIRLISEDKKNQTVFKCQNIGEEKKTIFALNANLLKMFLAHTTNCKVHMVKEEGESSYIYFIEDEKPAISLLLPCKR